ncbi:transcriptional regulator [Streptomyces phage ZL12]|uniref:Transcriptional regulator n=1 Tax=Streptomyces phage ZL12 TaxID=2570911 RepID=D0UWD6_9CAUD|nr:transcriptional regulator [Streptomyces phage ZL12]ACX71108.1 transcriptional regulator [Streptomyces phage ZL12]
MVAHHNTRGHQMKNTNRQTVTQTLTDLYKALDKQHVVTLSFLKEEKDDTGKKTGRLVEDVRSLEIYDIRTTRDGRIVVKGMDRATGEARTVRVDRVRAYTVHRIGFVLTRPEATTPAGAVIVVRSPAQLIARELGRDYLPARRIDQTHTSLAA